MSDRPPLQLLCGFLALLAVVFAVSYGVGAAVGPGAPETTRRTGTDGRTGPATGEDPGADMEDMHPGGDMGDMHSGR
ncbi:MULTISPECIES: hypothetical protein [Streptomyces]